MTSPIINALSQTYLRDDLPEFIAGDTVAVSVRIKEAGSKKGKDAGKERERLQVFEGVVIAKRSRGANSSFTVRKISYGEGVERAFPLHSPNIADIKVVRRGDVRRAKLYYLRALSGKAARIREKIPSKHKARAGDASTAKGTAKSA